MSIAKSRAQSKGRSVYTVHEVAQKLGISIIGAYGAMRDKKIPHVKIGRRFVIPKPSFDEWMKKAGHQEVAR